MSKTLKHVFFNSAAALMFGPAAGFNMRLRFNGADGSPTGIKPSTRPHAPRPGTDADSYVKAGETSFGYYKNGDKRGQIKSERKPTPSGIFELVKGKLGWNVVGKTAEGAPKMLMLIAGTAAELDDLVQTLDADDRADFEHHIEFFKSVEQAAAEAAEQARIEEAAAAEKARVEAEAKALLTTAQGEQTEAAPATTGRRGRPTNAQKEAARLAKLAAEQAPEALAA